MAVDRGSAALDRDLSRLLHELESTSSPAVHEVGPEHARRGFARLSKKLAGSAEDHGVRHEDAVVPGETPVPVRIFRPAAATGDEPCVVYLHGGGWVLGDLDTHHLLASLTSSVADVTVVSVDYRKAPEHPFPAAVEDVLSVLAWMAEGTSPFPESPALGVFGDSAGANLAVVGAARIHDLAKLRIDCLLLAYPLVNHVSRTESRSRFAREFLLQTATVEWFSRLYAGDYHLECMDRDPLANPVQADLSKLPDCRLLLAGHDPLRDEGLELADALQRAGVRVETMLEHSMIHGFLELGAVSEAARSITERELQLLGARLRLAAQRSNRVQAATPSRANAAGAT